MFYFLDDRTYINYTTNPALNEQIDYMKTGVVIYQAIYRTDENGYEGPVFLTNDTKRYIEMRYAHVSNNWNQSSGSKYGINYNYYPAKQCTKYDFMDNSTDEINFKGKGKTFNNKFFEAWEGYSLICVDNQNEKLLLSGTETSMTSDTL